MFRSNIAQFLYIMITCLSVFFSCESLKTAKPILPLKEYERLLIGDLASDYIGTDNCLKACHSHDKIRKNFEASTMGARLSPESGMPLVDCESCHGPGSLAVKGITNDKVETDNKNNINTTCNFDLFIDIKKLPAGAKSLICLKCHTKHADFNLHNWNAGVHAQNDVSCSDCHPIHKGPDLTTRPREVPVMCFSCHPAIKSEFYLPSHHPMNGRLFCNDCHEPHGSLVEYQLRKNTIKETCIRCHQEKGGPFIFEHADNMEDCMVCHRPHGSVNNNLLNSSQPFLCLQCHSGHRINTGGGVPSTMENKGAFYTRCTDCHSQIHGTDHPSASGTGLFTQ